MNIKKLLILPLAAFLVSCNSFFNPTFFSSSEEQPSHFESSIQDPVEPSIGYSTAPYPDFYGSPDMPLTVKDAIGIINADLPTYGHTQYPLYVEGIIRYNDKTGYDSTRNNYLFYLCDESDYSCNFYVYRAINGSNVSEIAYENDRVIVSGYVTQYMETPEMATVDTTQAYVYQINSRGYSPITVNNMEHGVISEIPSSMLNGSEVSFVAIPDSGYRVESVKINNVTIQPDNVTYRFIVKGDTNIKVKFIDDSTPEVNYGTEAEPLSVTEALAIAENECTDNGMYTNQPIYVTGAVKDSTSPRSGNVFRFYLNDLNESSISLYIYTCNAGEYSQLQKDDILIVYGYIRNHLDSASGQVVMEMDSNPQTELVPEIVSLTHNSSDNILDGEMNDVVWTDKVKQNYHSLSQVVDGHLVTSINVYANLNDDGLYIFVDYAVSEIKQGTQDEWWTWDNFEFRLANSVSLTWSSQYWMSVINGGRFVSTGTGDKEESMFYKPLTLSGDGLYHGAFEGFIPYGDDMLIQGSDIYICMGANPITQWICSPNFSGLGPVDTNSSQIVIRPGDGIIEVGGQD